MSKDLNVSRLCDVYGALLTDRRREIVRNYYDDDLSLAEIAENLGITRQAALCSIRQAEKQLNDYESKLGVLAQTDKLEAELNTLLRDVDDDVAQAKTRIRSLIDELIRQ